MKRFNIMVKKLKEGVKRLRNEIRLHTYRGKTTCMIGTMPKSGTWLCQYFFWSLKKYIENSNFDFINYNFKKAKVGNFYNFNDSTIFIGHASCPGYDLCSDDVYKDSWMKLRFWNSGYNWMNREIGKIYNPSFNQDVKILYVYREPLSQIFSLYNYCKQHSNALHRKSSSLSLIDFYTELSAIESYIKQFHTYKIMKKKFPNNILIIKYEELIKSPLDHFTKICNFFNVTNEKNLYTSEIKQATNFVDINNLKEIEKRKKRSLANDGSRSSHIQGTSHGHYSDYLKNNDLNKINNKLNILGYNLKDFNSFHNVK